MGFGALNFFKVWLPLSIFVSSKLMRLGVANQIVVRESNLKSEFDRQYWSDSITNDGFQSTIANSI